MNKKIEITQGRNWYQSRVGDQLTAIDYCQEGLVVSEDFTETEAKYVKFGDFKVVRDKNKRFAEI